ncbi:phosphoribosylglycinamide formyltransferase [Thermoanaerobacterium thermosaccharolyticum]|uniref:phosphoribosylglycinamide formyltransferase n=1 Tax=Thermoanaerobacterium thermosaccharolyticum TaxID=1517 RepID=UPI0017836B12|nr:phosphoribosylglycinamide formyltransferase [Thermoanaerobacterium thermosaccharolyticum]MBE0067837.1 phosphoribosylglycinamide formyltransferase [Thermoanaerobacterium thermosaccharolyticum]MBE0227400.1 phosphoribosylglycinamide formyltransferase [Thermoanaerobacterium thermosaccharolyticum]
MRLLVMASGNGTDFQSIIDGIKSGYINAEIAALISDKEGAYALKRAADNNIPSICIPKKKLKGSFYQQLTKAVDEINPDGIVLAGFITILNEEIVNKYQNKIINIHPSLIPSFCGKGYYGINVHKAVIEYGVKYTGCTVHFVDAGADTGPIILQEVVKVEDDDTPETISDKVLKLEHRLLPYAVKLFVEGRLKVVGRKVFII